MRQFKLIIFIFLITHAFCYGQSIVFNEVYDYGNNFAEGADYISKIPNTNETLVLSQNFPYLPSQGTASLRIFTIDQYGNVLRDTLYAFSNNGHVGTGVYFDSSFIYILGVVGDPAEMSGWDTYLLKLNYNLDSIYSRIIDIGYNDAGNSLQRIGENKFIYEGYYYKDSSIYENSQVVMVTIDTLGNVLDQWEFGGPSYDFAYDFKITPDKGYIIAGQTQDSLLDDSDLFLLKLDSAGNQEWYQEYGTPYEDRVRTWNYLEIGQNGNFYIASEKRYINGLSRAVSVLYNIDTLGNIVWKKNFENGSASTYSASIRIQDNGSIIVSNAIVYFDTLYPPFTEPRGMLIKLSPNGEDELWRRFFSKWWLDDDDPNGNGFKSHDYVQDMLITNDGGILISGYQIHPFITRNDAWLIKFDSCGFTVGAQPQALLTIDSVIGAQVYISNLSEEYCIGNLNISLYNPTTGDTTLLDSLHVYAYSQFTNGSDPTQIVYTLPDTGTYVFSLTTYAGDGINTFTTSIQVSDISTGLLSNQIVENYKFNIYPNPTNDYIIVSSGEVRPPGDEASLAIYTTTGQLIKTYSLNPNLIQEKILLGDLANGVYLLSISVDGRSVGFERLSIIK
jgi:hypothetical protein